MEIPTEHTRRLVLRGFVPEDRDPLHTVLSVPGVLEYFPRTEPWSLDMVQRWMDSQQEHWEEHGFGWFAVEYQGTKQLIGWCGLRVLEETEETEVLYLLDRAHWGKGLATEAARWCVEDGFRNRGLDFIIGLTHLENIASQRVLEKAGLVFSNQARYFDIDCRRYVVDQVRFQEFYANQRVD